jgi:hypothetical protein
LKVAGVGVLLVGAIIYLIKWRVSVYLEKKRQKETFASSLPTNTEELTGTKI